jgi:hypothetical protein
MAGFIGSQTVWGMAAQMYLADGNVQVLNSKGSARPAVIGMGIDTGETVVTNSGRAQLKFTDGGLVSLQPNSELKIDQYRFVDGAEEGQLAIFSFLKGGLRAVTGLIGHRNRPAYQMNTAVATIGIRGTEYQAVLADGLYVRVGDGRIALFNAHGEIELGRGETAHVTSADTAPERTTKMPAVTAKPSDQSQTPTIPGAGTDSGFQPGMILTTNNFGPVVPLYSAGLAMAAAGTVTDPFDGVTSTSAGSGAGAGINNSGALVGAYMNGNEVKGFVASSGGQFASIVFDSAQNVGSDGVLYWGRWTGTTATLFASLSGYAASAKISIPATASIHYLLGTTVPTIPTTGIATYNFVGGTPSTDQAGGVGQGITGPSTLTANFSTNSVAATFNVTHGSVYNATAIMPMGGNRASFSSDNAGGSFYASGYTGKASGFFAGTTGAAPSQAGLSFTINTPSPIVGVGAFRCSTGC